MPICSALSTEQISSRMRIVSNSTFAKSVADKLAAKGVVPSRAALASYASMQVYLEATLATAAAPPITIRQYLQDQLIATILGPIKFDATGAANIAPHVFHTWQAGKLLPPAQ